MMEKIKAVYCVTEQGASGMILRADGIEDIKIENILIDGDPFQHYVGRDKDGNMLRSIRMLCPCDIYYEAESIHPKGKDE